MKPMQCQYRLVAININMVTVTGNRDDVLLSALSLEVHNHCRRLKGLSLSLEKSQNCQNL